MKRLLVLAFLLFPTLAFAQAPTFLCAQTANAKNCTAAISPVSSAVLSSDLVVKAIPANLWSFEVSADATLSAAAWWIMIFDATTAPADGAVTPAKCYAVPLGTTSFTAAWLMPVQFQNGIVISVGTTGCFTKTASVHAFISGDAR